MKLKISIIIVLFGCGQGNQSELNLNDNSYLIEATELLKIANHPNIKIVDFRKKEPYFKFLFYRDSIRDAIYRYIVDLKQRINLRFIKLPTLPFPN